jgi:hypothetical protein
MAGKLAKCGCGEVITIPSVPAPQSVPFEPATTSPTGGSAAQSDEDTILFQCNYGLVRPFMFWLAGATVVIALILIPAGIFWNEGWTLARAELPPWGATLIFELVGFGLLLLIAYNAAGYLLHRRNPQRVAVTATGVILPGLKVSTKEHFLPWDRVRVRIWGGPVNTLDFKSSLLRPIRLVSVQFPTDDDFETFLDHLREHEKL